MSNTAKIAFLGKSPVVKMMGVENVEGKEQMKVLVLEEGSMSKKEMGVGYPDDFHSLERLNCEVLSSTNGISKVKVSEGLWKDKEFEIESGCLNS